MNIAWGIIFGAWLVIGTVILIEGRIGRVSYACAWGLLMTNMLLDHILR